MHVLYKGKRLPVDDSILTEDDRDWWSDKHAVVVDSDMKLIPTYLATFQKKRNESRRSETEVDFVAEKIYEKKPTQDELLQDAIEFGLSWYDIIGIEEVYQLLEE